MLTVLSLAGVLTQEAWANPAHERLKQMSSGERNALFSKLFQGSDVGCNGVTRSFFQGSGKAGDAFWNVACRNGQAYSIMIYNDAVGSSKIVDCQVLKAVNGGVCFKKF